METILKLNIAEFLAEYFTGSTGAKDQFSYGLFWDTVTSNSPESIKIMVDYMPKDEDSFYYEYGLLKADYCAGCSALETNIGYAINRVWTWFHTGFVNNFISKDPETNLLHLNW